MVDFFFDLESGIILICSLNGQNGVTVSTEACGASSPGSKKLTQVKPTSIEIPGSDPEEKEVII